MKDPKDKAKELLNQAGALAAKGQKEKAFELYQACMQTYLDDGMPMRALAAFKAARSTLGMSPKIQAQLIRLNTTIGLSGDADKEYQESSALYGFETSPLFKDLSREEVLNLMGIMEIATKARGEYLLKDGDKSEDIYFVVSGQLELLKGTERISLMQPGDMLGEIGFFYHKVRSASVKALEASTVIRLPAHALRQICNQNPIIGENLERLYTSRVIKKAGEDISRSASDLSEIYEIHLLKGTKISPFDGITIVKHGVVEVNYHADGRPSKKFMGPGTVLEITTGTAQANTDVDLILAKAESKSPQQYKP